MTRLARITAPLLLLLALGLSGCMHYTRVESQEAPLVVVPAGQAQPLVRRYAPAFLIQNPHQEHNLIGQPKAALDPQTGQEAISVDPAEPVIYYELRHFSTARAGYRNLIYRVHFPGTPFSLIPFLIGNGVNNGVIIVITLNEQDQPVLVTTVGTCGCYVSLSATNFTPGDALPPGRDQDRLEIYGESLPSRLDYPKEGHARLLVTLGPAEHRIRDLALLDAAGLGAPNGFRAREAALRPMAELRRLPLAGQPGGTTSLFVEDGFLAGHVKGSWKPLETLLLGLWSLDLVVGMDKDYGDPRNPFYTSLQPWYRNDSDMNQFARFLRFWEWNL